MSELYRPVHIDGKTYRLTPVPIPSRAACYECAFNPDDERCDRANARQPCVPWDGEKQTIPMNLVFKEVTS